MSPSSEVTGSREAAGGDIRVVLVGTSHPGNIGAVARAMKNMGLTHLTLVRPKTFPDPEAAARAAGADDVLAAATVVESVGEALAGCGFVIATTSRDRDQNFRVMDVRDAAERVVLEVQRGPVAMLFGAERTGLTNEELDYAHVLVRIPASPVYASLNVAMAVQLVAYEVYRATGARSSAYAQRLSTAKARAAALSWWEKGIQAGAAYSGGWGNHQGYFID